jgi:hypothetical protein
MRLRVGLVLCSVATVLVLCALPASWYHITVVGPDYTNAMQVGDPGQDTELRELNGDWSLWKHELTDEPFQVPPPQYTDPLTVNLYGDDEMQAPNANTIDVYSSTSAMVVAGAIGMAAAAFGAFNIARHDRWRAFTAASFVLAGILLFAAPAYFGSQLPSAMACDASTGDPLAFGAEYTPYINPDTVTPGFYKDLSGSYLHQTSNSQEQLTYGPGIGFFLSGAAAVLCLITAGVVYGASQWRPLSTRKQTREVLRYVPVPVVTNAPTVPRYTRRSGPYEAVSTSPGLPSDQRRTGIAQTPPPVARYHR